MAEREPRPRVSFRNTGTIRGSVAVIQNLFRGHTVMVAIIALALVGTVAMVVGRSVGVSPSASVAPVHVTDTPTSISLPTSTLKPLIAKPIPAPTSTRSPTPTPTHTLVTILTPMPTPTHTPAPTLTPVPTPTPTSTPRPLPNLSSHVPGGWDMALVASSVPGTNVSDTLNEEDGTYFDWAIRNNSAIPIQGSFKVNLLLDGAILKSWKLGGLNTGQVGTRQDFYLKLGKRGSHVISLVIDADQEIAESNENDNTIEMSVF